MSRSGWQGYWEEHAGRLVWGVVAVWSILIGASLLWDLHRAREFALELAHIEAQLSYEKDLAYRLWGARHGGVYVPVTPQSPPNPYLTHVAERDIQTPSGRALTLVNPAYMTRQVHELAAQLYGTRGHLTSLKPLRPENAPDDWEARALAAFESGGTEIIEVVSLAGQPHMRLMRPWRVEAACLKCHADQGYKVGDIRGGISTAVPLQPYLAGFRVQTRTEAVSHGLIWLLGVAGIIVGGGRLQKHLNERRQAEAELAEILRQKEEALTKLEHLASFPRLNPNPVLEIDLQGDITYANQAAGEALEQLAPESDWRDFLPPNWQEIEKSIRKTGGKSYECEVRIKDRVFSESIAFAEPFDVWRIYARDITKRKQAEAELRESEAKFRNLFENMAEGVVLHEIICDTDGQAVDYRILAANPAFEKHTGLKVADIAGRQASQAYGTGEAPYLEIYAAVAQTGRPDAFESFFPPRQRYFHISVTSPKPGHFVTVFEDISERRKMEAALQMRTTELSRAVADLEEKNAELERFTYMISHDLKSPVVTISTFLGYLEEDLASGAADRVAKDIQFMRLAAERMRRLLQELLELSRLGRVVNPPVEVTFQELVAEALNVVAGSLVGRGLDVRVITADITLYGDRPRLMEIWQNLVENAVKFMGQQPEPHLEIGLEEQGADTVFFVCDNGIGIDPQYQGKIFSIFEKLDVDSEGTGIGLALVKRIVELHKGSIWVESAGRGQGACFRFTLPGALAAEKQRLTE
jgi:PAS domain S-box-containing protein